MHARKLVPKAGNVGGKSSGDHPAVRKKYDLPLRLP